MKEISGHFIPQKNTKRKHRKKISMNVKIDWNPNTKRFCKGCNKDTTFQFNKYLGHSACRTCGMRIIPLGNLK